MKNIICKEADCGRNVYAHGLCEMHYWRVRRHGDASIRLRHANGEGGLRGNRTWRQDGGRKKQAAAWIVEKVLGHPLPNGAIVHHINEDESDNRNENLIACQGQGLHNIIHGRVKALKACGNARWKPCRICHQYDDPARLFKNGTSHYHKKCNNEYSKRRRQISLTANA